MTTAILADDEPHMRAALRDHLAALWPDLQVIAEAEDGPAALRLIEQHRPDIAFLDIRMPGLTGLEVARSMTGAALVVFVTAYENHAVEAFEANAIDYVLKPLELPRLTKLVAKLRQSLAAPSALTAANLSDALARLATGAPSLGRRLEWLQVAVGQQVHMVHVDDVRYFESDTKYTRVVAETTDGLIRTPLKELLEQLDANEFLQTHRSVLVNRRYIRAVHRRGEVMELELRGRNERLRVSSTNHHLFRAM